VNSYARFYEKNRERIREQKRIAMARARKAQPEKYREQSRKSKAMLRQRVLDAYGRVCVGCGFADERALTLDHVHNNGAEERRSIGERGVYRRALIVENQNDYQILCMNCQFIKRVEAGRQNQHVPAVVRLAWETLTNDR
jgi:hypothetical protein